MSTNSNTTSRPYDFLPEFFIRSQPASRANGQDKNIIGETARITVSEAKISFLARIDTGARGTSIHAVNIRVKNGSKNKRDNIGKEISFTTANEKNEYSKVTTTIIDVTRVRNIHGVDYRYVIDLNLNWQGMDKDSYVNLCDRSAMNYKLLIGRNWLAKDFIVDVDASEGIIK